MSITGDLMRTQTVLQSRPDAQAQRNLLQAAADKLNRAGVVAAKVELANTALEGLAMLVYAADSDGGPCNFDPHAGNRLLVPLPWGRLGCKTWGIRPTEARTFSAVMLARSANPAAWWLRYDASSKSWCIDGRWAESLALALHLIQHKGISLSEWREHESRLRTAWAKSAREHGKL